MRCKLLETKGNTFFVFIEIENNNLDFLIKFDNLFRMVDTAPAKVGNVDQAVNAAQVNKYTVAGDVLDGTFEDLSFFKFLDDLSFLCFKFILDEGFVRNNHILVFVVDFDHLEFHDFIDKNVVIADRLDIDL